MDPLGICRWNRNCFCLFFLFFFDTPLGSVWMEEWKSGRMENCGRMKMWEDGKYLVFPLVCLVGGVEK